MESGKYLLDDVDLTDLVSSDATIKVFKDLSLITEKNERISAALRTLDTDVCNEVIDMCNKYISCVMLESLTIDGVDLTDVALGFNAIDAFNTLFKQENKEMRISTAKEMIEELYSDIDYFTNEHPKKGTYDTEIWISERHEMLNIYEKYLKGVKMN